MRILKTADGFSESQLEKIAAANREEWLSAFEVSNADREEALSLSSEVLISRFTRLSGFGTAGIRGVMRAGLSEMNVYTVALVTASLARLIKKSGVDNPSVVIAYDSRNNSRVFSKACAAVLAREGIKVYFFESLRPTPELSFAILELKATAGINMTASHNPAPDNGYKCYWSDGAQMPPKEAALVADGRYDIDILHVLDGCDFDAAVRDGLIEFVGAELDEKYLSNVLAQSVFKSRPELSVVYTPLHGAGYKLVPELLSRDGFDNVVTVAEQAVPDGDFPTVEKPNPQYLEAFRLGIDEARRTGAELVIATDPDADRMGMAVKTSSGEFEVLSGNQAGCLMIDFLIKLKKHSGTLPENACVVKSLVSTELADVICRANGVSVANVYTGFKYIGEKINEWKKSGEYSFLLGFEESYGYLGGEYARDKDAVFASLMAAEMAAYYKTRGMNLYDAMQEIYSTYGYRADYLENIEITALDFKAEVAKKMEALRKNPPSLLAGSKVTFVNDYLTGIRSGSDGSSEKIALASENMISFETASDCKLIVRPSGTEPKMKVYIFVKAEDEHTAKQIKTAMLADIKL